MTVKQHEHIVFLFVHYKLSMPDLQADVWLKSFRIPTHLNPVQGRDGGP